MNRIYAILAAVAVIFAAGGWVAYRIEEGRVEDQRALKEAAIAGNASRDKIIDDQRVAMGKLSDALSRNQKAVAEMKADSEARQKTSQDALNKAQAMSDANRAARAALTARIQAPGALACTQAIAEIKAGLK